VTSLFVTVMDAEHLAVILATTLVLLGSSMHYTADAENRHVFLDWEVSYAVRSPLGVARRVITIDGRLPGPLLNLTTNDVAHINVVNTLDEPFLLTWCFVRARCHSATYVYLPAGTDQ
jgi:iron transport multicopper oxidase